MCHRLPLLQDGEFAIAMTIAQCNATVSDDLIHSMGRELSLKTGLFFQTPKSQSSKEHSFQKKAPTKHPGLHIWYWCFHMFLSKLCTDKLATCTPFTNPSKSYCILLALAMIIKVCFLSYLTAVKSIMFYLWTNCPCSLTELKTAFKKWTQITKPHLCLPF